MSGYPGDHKKVDDEDDGPPPYDDGSLHPSLSHPEPVMGAHSMPSPLPSSQPQSFTQHSPSVHGMPTFQSQPYAQPSVNGMPTSQYYAPSSHNMVPPHQQPYVQPVHVYSNQNLNHDSHPVMYHQHNNPPNAVVMGGPLTATRCSDGGSHLFENEFTPCGICCAACFFPWGLCRRCGFEID